MTIKLFWILFFLTVIFQGAHNLTINDFEIRDLEDTTSYFTTEAQPWQVINQVGVTTTTQCQGNWMLGGYGVIGAGTVFSRVYQSLPAHNFLQFSVTFWIIDLAESTSLFEIYFDNQLVGQWNSNNYDFTTLGTTDICGGSQADYSSIVITGEVAHNAQSLTLKVSSLFTGGTNHFSFGFRNLNLLFYGSGSASTSVCQFVDTSNSESSCFCPSGQYDKAGNPSCKSCNAACSTCLGPNNKECASCASGYSFDGAKCVQCVSSCGQCSSSDVCTQCTSDKFLYWNSTCLASCDSPLVQNIQGIYKSCEMPCDDSNKYLYQNNTCGLVCPSPLVSSQKAGVKLCNFPCATGSFYYTWNSTCITSCESPLVQRTQGTESYCDLPCESSKYLYEDNTCGSTCLSPLVSSQNGQVKLCGFPCDSGSFYYSWNSTCIASCDSPLIQSIQGTYKYCELPCNSNEYFYEEDDTCRSDCLTPMESSLERDVKLCSFPCEDDEFYYSLNSTCIASCDSPLIQNTQEDYQYCELPCNTNEYFYEEDDTCRSDCSTPMESSLEGDVQLCNFPCSSDSFYSSWNSTCISSCDSPLVQNTQGDYQSCELPCDSSEYLYQNNNTCEMNCLSPMVPSQNGEVKLCSLPCDNGSFYYLLNSTCIASCDSPLVQIIQGTYKYCELPCNSSEYLYEEDNTCHSDCSTPMKSSQKGDVKLCSFPCEDDEFYYSLNSTCIASCESPLVQSIQADYQYCELPCNSNEYFYEDNTCHSDCPSPLESSQEGDVKLCNFPCDNGSFYSSWNLSCIDSCNSPLVQSIQGDYQYCELPCNSNEYFYEDNTCHSDCPTPMEPSQEDSIKLCNSPCSSGLFYYENSTCHNSCPSPYISVDTPYLASCNKPCPNSQYYNKDHDACLTSCDSPNLIQDEQGIQICVEVVVTTNTSDFVASPLTQAIGSVASGLSSVANVIRPSSSNSVFMTALAKLVKYVKYMNVSLPDQVRQAFESSNSSSFSISTTLSYSMPQSLEGSLQQHPLPETFERTELNSSYLMNQWSSFSTLSLVFCLGVTFYALDIYAQRSRKSPRLASFSKRMRILTEWNLLLYFIFNIYDDLTLFMILELKTLHFDSFASYLSFFACVCVSVFALFLLGMTLYIPHQRRKTSEEVPFYLKWKNLQVLYAGYETKSLLQRNFLFISTVRIVICYIMVGCFYSSPVVQTPVFLMTSLVIVFILIKLRPIKDWLNWVFALGFEGLMLVMNFCLLILAIADCYTEEMTPFKMKVSQVILVTNTMVDIASALYVPACLIGCAYYCYNVCKKSRKSGQSKKIVWLNMLICIYSNPGMDFDDLSNELDGSSEKTNDQKKRFTARITPLVITPISVEEKSFIQMSPLSQSNDKLIDRRVSIPGSPIMGFDSSRRLMMSAPGTLTTNADPKVEIHINNSSYIPQNVDGGFNGSKLEVHPACYNKLEDSFLCPSTMTKAESIRDNESVETKGTSIEVEDEKESWSGRRRMKPRAQTQKMGTNGLNVFSTSAYSRQSVFGKASSTRDELPNEDQKIFEFGRGPNTLNPKKRISHPSSRLWRSSLKRASLLSSNANLQTISGTKIFFDLESAAGTEINRDSSPEDSGTFEYLKEDNVGKPKKQPLILVNNLLTSSSLRKGSDSLSNYSNEAESV